MDWIEECKVAANADTTYFFGHSVGTEMRSLKCYCRDSDVERLDKINFRDTVSLLKRKNKPNYAKSHLKNLFSFIRLNKNHDPGYTRDCVHYVISRDSRDNFGIT